MKASQKHFDLANRFCKAYTFIDINDKQTKIPRDTKHAQNKINALKDEIIATFHKEHTKKLRLTKNPNNKDRLTFLRQLLRAFDKRLIVNRQYVYCKKIKRSKPLCTYKII